MSDTPTTAGDAPQREMTLAEYMAQLPIFHRAHREYVELLQDRAALPSVPVDDKPAPTPHTFVPAMDGGSASCAECGESWPCSAWIEQQRVRRDDPALLRQAVVECLPPEIVKLAEDIYAPTLGGMLMEYVAELEGQLEDRAKSAPLPSGEPTSDDGVCVEHGIFSCEMCFPASPPQDAPRRAEVPIGEGNPAPESHIKRMYMAARRGGKTEAARQTEVDVAVCEVCGKPAKAHDGTWSGLNVKCERTERDVLYALVALYASPAAPVDLSAVEAAIDDLIEIAGHREYAERRAIIPETDIRALCEMEDAAKSALLSLYRTALSGGVPAKEAGEPKADTRIQTALELARSYGSTDGAHHKMWLIDQMVRALLPNDGEYEAWVVAQKAGEDGPDTYEWDEGIAP